MYEHVYEQHSLRFGRCAHIFMTSVYKFADSYTYIYVSYIYLYIIYVYTYILIHVYISFHQLYFPDLHSLGLPKEFARGRVRDKKRDPKHMSSTPLECF